MPNINTGTVAWDWTQGGGGPADSFDILVGTVPNTYSCAPVSVGGAVRQYALSSLVSVPGTYYMRVRAINTASCSPNSNEIGVVAWVGLSLKIT